MSSAKILCDNDYFALQILNIVQLEENLDKFLLKGLVHCFSMQVVINKCFLLNPEKKIGADLSCRFREERTL